MIGRRGAIGGLMTWWAAGNARTPQGPQSREGNRPDRKPLGVTRAGVGPAPQQGTFIGRVVIVGGTGIVGFFEYNGAPGAGNPPIAYSAPPGVTKDPYGNTLPQTAGGFVSIQGTAFSELQGGGVTLGQTGINVASAGLTVSGSANTNAQMVLHSGTAGEAGATPSLITLWDSGANGNVQVTDGRDGNIYDTERLTLITPATTINSSTIRVNVFSQHLGVGSYEIEVWLVSQNTTAADAAAWSFAASGGLVAGAGSLVDFQTISGTGPAVVNYTGSSTLTQTFNGQGITGNQQLIVRATAVITTAGTLTFGGLELVSGNTITISAGGRMRICPVVATT